MDLVRTLGAVPPHPDPKPGLEQYRTPPEVAVPFLRMVADERPETVVDLGCGTGMLTIGAALLGLRAVGYDIDRGAIEVARRTARAMGVEVRFEVADVADVEDTAEVVVMNAPFGAQRENRRGDRAFLDASQRIAPVTWLLAPPVSERFLTAVADVEKVGEWDFLLPATMAHHTKEAHRIRVGGYRIAW